MFISLYSGFIKEYLSIFGVLLFHEFGHLLMIKLFKGKINSFEVSPIGCFIDYNTLGINKIKRIIINSSGIICNIVLCLVLKNDYLIRFNNYMLIFNLLSIYPLDGYRIVEEVLDCFYEKEYLNTLMFCISIVSSLTFFVLIFFIKCYGYLIILFYLMYKNINKYRCEKLKHKTNFYKNSILLNRSVSVRN